MKWWGWLILPLVAGLVGSGFKAANIEPDGSWGWFAGVGLGFALVAAYSVNRAQERWPRDGSAPTFDAAFSLALTAAALAAALVMAGLAMVGGLSK